MHEPIKIKQKNKVSDEKKKGQCKDISVRTEAEALSEDAPRRHVFLSFDLGEVEGAGEDENVHQVDEAL